MGGGGGADDDAPSCANAAMPRSAVKQTSARLPLNPAEKFRMMPALRRFRSHPLGEVIFKL
jgi:hypothetical protein